MTDRLFGDALTKVREDGLEVSATGTTESAAVAAEYSQSLGKGWSLGAAVQYVKDTGAAWKASLRWTPKR